MTALHAWVGVVSGVLAGLAVVVGGGRWLWVHVLRNIEGIVEDRIMRQLTTLDHKVTSNGGYGQTLGTQVQRIEAKLNELVKALEAR